MHFTVSFHSFRVKETIFLRFICKKKYVFYRLFTNVTETAWNILLIQTMTYINDLENTINDQMVRYISIRCSVKDH
jgi:hypothetical protein